MRRLVVAALFAAFVALVGGCGGCKQPPVPADPAADAQASPQAKAIPAPLATVTTPASALPAMADAGPPPAPIRADVPIGPDALVKEVVGYSLQAILHPSDPPPP